MSRGNKAPIVGILSSSMRENYDEFGVEEYYKKVGATYRNPHFPGIRSCLFIWFNRWWQMEHLNVSRQPDNQILLFDMACGSGEVTLPFAEWWKAGKRIYAESSGSKETPFIDSQPATVPLRRKPQTVSVSLGPEFPPPRVAAADPFTSVAYKDRTSLECSSLSFKEIAEGHFPNIYSDISKVPIQVDNIPENAEGQQSRRSVEMVICSFALHLVENPSELFSLLWELSTYVRWLVVLAPHKKPEIKEGWGWSKWDVDTWQACQVLESAGELLRDRVRCRVYRSLNVQNENQTL